MLGLDYHARALVLLRATPRLWPLLWAPAALNVLVGGALYAAMLWGGWQLLDLAIAALPAWAAAAAPVARVLLGIALLLLAGLLIGRFGVVLGAPWYGKLSEEIEEAMLGEPMPPSPGAWAELRQALGYEVKKLALSLGIGLPLLVIGLVPVLGTAIAGAGGLLLAWTIVCLDFLDPSLSRRRLRFREKLATVYRTLPETAGFGALSLVLVGLPFINMLTVPWSMAAGAMLFAERVRPRLEEATPPRA